MAETLPEREESAFSGPWSSILREPLSPAGVRLSESARRQANDADFASAVPTYAATAWHHNALAEQPKNLDALLAEVWERGSPPEALLPTVYYAVPVGGVAHLSGR